MPECLGLKIYHSVSKSVNWLSDIVDL